MHMQDLGNNDPVQLLTWSSPTKNYQTDLCKGPQSTISTSIDSKVIEQSL